jgi:hypothetical protein
MTAEGLDRPARMPRRDFLQLIAAGGVAALTPGCATPPGALSPTPIPPSPDPLVPVTYGRLPRWRGFNLVDKLSASIPTMNKPYDERDLDCVAEWGFDFVRLPTDYNIWTTASGEFREQPLKELDQVIGWARARGIHVNLALHRAPGYCVNPPKEPMTLWADDPGGVEARARFADQWRMFSARLRDIPTSALSFNLVNEPPAVTGEQYLRAVEPAVSAIRDQDPDRLIIADGANFGRKPVEALVPLKLAQSMRGYDPFQVTRYRSAAMEGADRWPEPTWPLPVSVNQFLYGDWKPERRSPLTLTGDLAGATQCRVTVHQVSNNAELVIRADGVEVLRRTFRPGAGQGEWKKSVYREEWRDYLGTYDLELAVALPPGTRELRFAVEKGDWLTLSEIRLSPFPALPASQLVIRPGDPLPGVRHEPLVVRADGTLLPASGRDRYDREALWRDGVWPWKEFSGRLGIGLHVGEWGADRHTPHPVVLAWMRDCLANWRRAGVGWALWNLEGPFGVLNSGRGDVAYESYKGRKLDRRMLELLREG